MEFGEKKEPKYRCVQKGGLFYVQELCVWQLIHSYFVLF